MSSGAIVQRGKIVIWKGIQENFVYKEPRSLKAKSKAKKIKFWTFVWTCYTWSKCNMEDAIVFYDTA